MAATIAVSSIYAMVEASVLIQVKSSELFTAVERHKYSAIAKMFGAECKDMAFSAHDDSRYMLTN